MKVPGGHLTHVSRTARWVDGHGRQVVEFGLEIVFEGHGRQNPLLTRPVRVEKVPLGHGIQLVAFWLDLLLPLVALIDVRSYA